MYTFHNISLMQVSIIKVRVCTDPRTGTFRYINYAPIFSLPLIKDCSDTKRYITVLQAMLHTWSDLFLHGGRVGLIGANGMPIYPGCWI